MAGRFITFEGGEGAGKSTQVGLVAARLEKVGITAIRTREVGGTPEADIIRKLFLADAGAEWLPLSQAMLANTARHEHTERLIRPALARGDWVISDRFSDSTLVYQSLQGVAGETLSRLQQLAIGDFAPDVTFLFDLDPEAGFARLERSSRVKDRFETMGLEYHRRVAEAYRVLAAEAQERFIVVDAMEDIDAVTSQIVVVLNDRYGISA